MPKINNIDPQKPGEALPPRQGTGKIKCMPPDTIHVNSVSLDNNIYTTTNNPEASSVTRWSQYPPQRQYQIEYGWECPRCGKINAPWKSQCDCTRNNWTITCNGTNSNVVSKDYISLNDLVKGANIDAQTATLNTLLKGE